MTPQPTPSAPPRRWLHDAAALLGADTRTCASFASTGQVAVNGRTIEVQPLFDYPGAPWAAVVAVPCPPGIDAAAWCDALLLANGMTMVLDSTSFVTVDGAARLVTRIASDERGSALLAARLQALSSLCDSVVDGVLIGARPLPAADVAPPAQTPAAAAPPKVAPRHGNARLSRQVRDAARALGAPPAVADADAEAGRIQVRGRQVEVAFAIDDVDLLLALPLSDSLLEGAAGRQAALAAAGTLMPSAGITIALCQGRAVLLTRFSPPGTTSEVLARYLEDFVALGCAIEADAAAQPAAARLNGGRP